MTGVFLSVPSALHVSYMMPAYETAPQSILAKIMRMHIGEHDIWGYARPKVVFFDGLSPEQIRAQCTQIRAKVVRLLPRPEAAVVRARYGLTEYEDLVSGERRFAFNKDRALAMRYLAKWLTPSFSRLDRATLLLLVARVFANQRQTPITLRQLAAEHGFSHVYYHNYFHAIEQRLAALEMRALDLLTPMFNERGTCNGEPVVATSEYYESGQ